MCKDRTKNLSLYRKKNVRSSPSRKKGQKKGSRTADSVQSIDTTRDTTTDPKSPHSPNSLSPCPNKDSSNERADSTSPGNNGKGNSKDEEEEGDAPMTPQDEANTDAVANGDCSDDATLSACSPTQTAASSPSKNKGTNPNAKPFVMTPNGTQRTNAKSTMNGRHREDYQPPPRLRENQPGFQPHSYNQCPPASKWGDDGGREQPHQVTTRS